MFLIVNYGYIKNQRLKCRCLCERYSGQYLKQDHKKLETGVLGIEQKFCVKQLLVNAF